MDREEFRNEQRRAEKEDEYDQVAKANRDLRKGREIWRARVVALREGLIRIQGEDLDTEQMRAIASAALLRERELQPGSELEDETAEV